MVEHLFLQIHNLPIEIVQSLQISTFAMHAFKLINFHIYVPIAANNM